MGTKSRESIYGGSIRASAERAAEARKEADRLACEAWNQRMLGYKGPAQPDAKTALRCAALRTSAGTSGGAADNKDFGQRSAVDVVAGRANEIF